MKNMKMRKILGIVQYVENNGVLNTNYNIPWENFRNTIMVINSEGLNKINTRIYKIINISE